MVDVRVYIRTSYILLLILKFPSTIFLYFLLMKKVDINICEAQIGGFVGSEVILRLELCLWVTALIDV